MYSDIYQKLVENFNNDINPTLRWNPPKNVKKIKKNFLGISRAKCIVEKESENRFSKSFVKLEIISIF